MSTHHTLASFVRALGRRPYWMAGWKILADFERPLDVLVRYIFGGGSTRWRSG